MQVLWKNVSKRKSILWSHRCWRIISFYEWRSNVDAEKHLFEKLFKLMSEKLINKGVFPKWSRTFTEFSEFREIDNHWSMNWAWFKDPVSHMCLAGTVEASWSLTQEVAGSSPFTVMINFCHWIRWIQWKHLGRTPRTRIVVFFERKNICPGINFYVLRFCQLNVTESIMDRVLCL